MSRSSQLELHVTDSQVSLPSEPPDIGNWFSSYIYESPDLNTLDGFQNCGGSGETCLEKEKKGKYSENPPEDKLDDGLIAVVKESPDGIVMCNESDYSISAKMVTELSESLSFSSEPPDIKNWFSSYLYESPLLDTTHDFTMFDYKSEDGELCNAQKSCRQDNKNVMDDIIDVGKSTELSSQSRISNVFVKCTNLVKDTKLDHQSEQKDSHNVDLNPTPSMPSQLTSVSKQRTGKNNHGFVNKFELTNTYAEDYNAKSDCSLINRTSSTIMNIENYTGNLDEKSAHFLTGKKNCVKDSLEKEDSLRRHTERRNFGKENDETELLDGFISTRKRNTRENTGNIKRHARVQVESLRNRVKLKPELNNEKAANISRKVLSETTNFHSPNILESIGKWHCPQKNKPDLGPPLKQLRLEQWVRRV